MGLHCNMSDTPSTSDSRGGRGFGRGRGSRGRGRGRGGAAGGNKSESNVWVPVTKLGRLVKERYITDLERIYRYALPIKESQIIDYFLPTLKDEVVKIMPVQKQTTAGQRTRFKAFVVVGDGAGHLGLGVKCASEVAGSIQGAITAAKLSVVPIRKGYWGNKIGAPHTIPSKVTGKCGSVSVRLVPAPRGTGVLPLVLLKNYCNLLVSKIVIHPHMDTPKLLETSLRLLSKLSQELSVTLPLISGLICLWEKLHTKNFLKSFLKPRKDKYALLAIL